MIAGMIAVTVAVADELPEARFHSVKAWRGTFTASTRSNENLLPFKIPGARFTYDATLRVEFYLDQFEDEPAVWRGRVVSSTLDSAYRCVLTGKEGTVVSRFSTSGSMELDSDEAPELRFSPKLGWAFQMKGSVKRKSEVHKTITLNSGQVWRDQQTSSVFGIRRTPRFPFPAKGYVLAGSGPVETTQITSSPLIGVDPHPTWTVTVHLEPASLEELKLEIEEPADYKKWRPKTTAEAEAGEPLVVKANVTTANGGKPPVKVTEFIWELVGTSTEPGVAMNYPVMGDNFYDGRRDLELDADGEFFVLEEEKQRMRRAVKDGFSDTAKIVPFDMGGWSTLQVTAVMADGRRVQGKLTGKSEFGLRVPKRNPDSHIAEGWKEENKSGADDLDDENDPVGDGNKGDGFALYEEYRGWIVNGEPMGGDPKKKDFFVLNRIGPDAEKGIGLFAALSDLNVHVLESENEMAVDTRLMNQNYMEGAHVVDQHGVWIKTFDSAEKLGGSGAFTVPTPENEGKHIALRPGLTRGIGILPRGHAESDFSKPFNLPASEASGAYDRAIAHELMHSVGAVEHGTGDGSVRLQFYSVDHPGNKLGRPYFTSFGINLGAAPVYELRDEDGSDVAQKIQQSESLASERQKWNDTMRGIYQGRPGDADYPRMSERDFDFYRESSLGGVFQIEGQVGVQGGQHSGHQECIMRYYFADLYEMAGGKGFYRIAAGAEHIGFYLCRSPAGTGVNAPGHKPQSRHGPAGAGGGNCFGQLCPNDAIPPRASQF